MGWLRSNLLADIVLVLALLLAWWTFVDRLFDPIEVYFYKQAGPVKAGGVIELRSSFVRHRDCRAVDARGYVKDSSGAILALKNIDPPVPGWSTVDRGNEEVILRRQIPKRAMPGPAEYWTVFEYDCGNPLGYHVVTTARFPIEISS